MPPSHEIVRLAEIRLIGKSIRTANARADEIGEFWGRLFAEGHFDRIPNRTADDKYGVYTDYESDHTGEYTLFVGSPVSTFDEVPDGMTTLLLPATKYARFPLPAPTPDAIISTWQAIWASDLEPARAYAADFDCFFTDPGDGEVKAEICIGLR